jgi:hypothetical protein
MALPSFAHMINISKDIFGNAPAPRSRNSRAGPGVDWPFCICARPHADVCHRLRRCRRRAGRQLFRRAQCAGVPQCESASPAREATWKRKASAMRNRTFASLVAHVRWFRRQRARDRARTAPRVNGRTKCEILFQSSWRRFCSLAGPWPRRPTTRARQESTGCLGQVFPRVGPRFVRAAIMRGAARFAAGASPPRRQDFEIRRIYQRSMSSFEISKVDAIGVANPSYAEKGRASPPSCSGARGDALARPRKGQPS